MQVGILTNRERVHKKEKVRVNVREIEKCCSCLRTKMCVCAQERIFGERKGPRQGWQKGRQIVSGHIDILSIQSSLLVPIHDNIR